MVFSEKVRLGIPTRDELQELESNVMALERLTNRSSTSSLQLEEDITATSAIFPSALTRRRRAAALGRSSQSALRAKETIKGLSRSSANPLVGLSSTSEFSKLRNEVTDIKAFNRKLSQSFGTILNPVGTIQGRALSFGAGIPGVGVAASLAPIIYQMIVQQHGAGGIFDVTKQTLDNTKTFIGLEREVGISAGESLFLGNVSLRQGIPHNITSNTQDLQDGLRRYTLQTNQFGR